MTNPTQERIKILEGQVNEIVNGVRIWLNVYNDEETLGKVNLIYNDLQKYIVDLMLKKDELSEKVTFIEMAILEVKKEYFEKALKILQEKHDTSINSK